MAESPPPSPPPLFRVAEAAARPASRPCGRGGATHPALCAFPPSVLSSRHKVQRVRVRMGRSEAWLEDLKSKMNNPNYAKHKVVSTIKKLEISLNIATRKNKKFMVENFPTLLEDINKAQRAWIVY